MKPDPLRYGHEATDVGITPVIRRPGTFARSMQSECIRTKPSSGGHIYMCYALWL